MKSTQRVVETFDRDNVPHPHEDVHCETVKATPVCIMKCKCGFEGMAQVVNGKPICPAHLARVAQHERETNQTMSAPTVDVTSDAFQQAVNKALENALKARGGTN